MCAINSLCLDVSAPDSLVCIVQRVYNGLSASVSLRKLRHIRKNNPVIADFLLHDLFYSMLCFVKPFHTNLDSLHDDIIMIGQALSSTGITTLSVSLQKTSK